MTLTWWQDHLALFAVVVGGGRHYLFALVVDDVGVFSRFSQLTCQNAFRMDLHFLLFYFSPLFSLADQLLQVGVDTVYFNLVRKQHYHIARAIDDEALILLRLVVLLAVSSFLFHESVSCFCLRVDRHVSHFPSVCRLQYPSVRLQRPSTNDE